MGLADQPLVGARRTPGSRPPAATHRSGPPPTTVGRAIRCWLARSLWPEAMQFAGDVGARSLHARRHSRVESTAPTPGARPTSTPSKISSDCSRRTSEDRRQLPGRRAGRGGLEGAARPRAHRPVHARRAAHRGRGRRVPRHVKVKVGPITAQYKGVAKIERGRRGRTARWCSRPRAATRAARATRRPRSPPRSVPDGDGTTVNIDTDLNITGKVAQFGRGVMADVSSKLLGQFAENLERDVLSGGASPAAESRGARRRRRPRPRADTAPTRGEAPAREAVTEDRRAGSGAHRPDGRGRRLVGEADRRRSSPAWWCCSRCVAASSSARKRRKVRHPAG